MLNYDFEQYVGQAICSVKKKKCSKNIITQIDFKVFFKMHQVQLIYDGNVTDNQKSSKIILDH